MLEGIRILELTDNMAGSFGLCHLADMGAEVLKIEAPGMTDRGQVLPAMRPLPEAPYDYYFEYFNRNKKSFALNLDEPADMAKVYQLAERCHVFGTTLSSDRLKRLGLDYRAMKKINPALVYARCSGFGPVGPDKNKPMLDEIAEARAGMMPILPEPGYPPTYTNTGYALAGLCLAYGIILALFHQQRTGRGQIVDISLLGTHLMFNCVTLGATLAAGPMRELIEPTSRREGANPLLAFYRSQDDWVSFSLTATDPWWHDFCQALGLENLEHDPRFDTHIKRTMVSKDELFSIVENTFKSKKWAEWQRPIEELDLPIQHIDNYEDVLKGPQVWANNFIVEYKHPKHGWMRQIGSPVQLNSGWTVIKSPAPNLGEHNGYLSRFLDSTPSLVEELKKIRHRRAGGVLEGIRVIDCSPMLAGPLAGANLADMGADVIKLESTAGGDPARGVIRAARMPILDWNWLFTLPNRNKRSLAVDLKQERGRELVYKLVEKTDVFVSGQRIQALGRLGLSYEALSRVNPRLVYVVGTGFGRYGPLKDKPAYDVLAQARTGLQRVLGEPGHPPIWTGNGTGDVSAGLLMAYAVLLGLFHRERTGKGQEIYTSLFSAQLVFAARSLVPYLATGDSQTQQQYSRQEAPNPLFNMYPTADRWLMMAMWDSGAYWPFLCRALGQPELVHDARFDSEVKRKANHRALIEILDGVLKTRSCDEWLKAFHKLGLIAEPVNSGKELLQDQQPYQNGYIQEIEVPGFGQKHTLGFPIGLSETPGKIRSSHPELGQHNEEIMLELGYTWEEIAGLKESRIIL